MISSEDVGVIIAVDGVSSAAIAIGGRLVIICVVPSSSSNRED